MDHTKFAKFYYVKRKNLSNVKTKNLKNFITVIRRPTEISCPHSSKGQKKNVSLSFSMKTLKILRRLG